MKSVLSVDVAKGKSMIMLSTEYGEVLIEPKEIKHNFRDFNELKDKIDFRYSVLVLAVIQCYHSLVFGFITAFSVERTEYTSAVLIFAHRYTALPASVPAFISCFLAHSLKPPINHRSV